MDPMIRQLLVLSIALSVITSASADRPLIVAHRGASKEAPENTLAAFDLAWVKGADAIEGDFHLTNDGQIVCIHDSTTKRVAKRDLVVANSTLKELQKLDVGSWLNPKYAGTRIPTLDQVLKTVPSGKMIYIEIKSTATIVPSLIRVIKDSELELSQIMVISFRSDVIKKLEGAAPQYSSALLTKFEPDRSRRAPTASEIVVTLKKSQADGISSTRGRVTPEVIRHFQKVGYHFHFYTIDDAATGRLLKKWGADSITTNVPGKMAEWLKP